MKILMLGWEYPPHISGGLGTACEGLTTALARQNVDITFVVPHLFGGENAEHMALLDARGASRHEERERTQYLATIESEELATGAVGGGEGGGKVKTVQIPSALSPYFTPESYQNFITSLQQYRARRAIEGTQSVPGELLELFKDDSPEIEIRGGYGGDIFSEVARYARNVVTHLAHQEFDLIHAHDWMTYPAGVALAQVTGKPLVVHVHSLEHDRSGAGANHQINEIERWGTGTANHVIAVSYYTRSLIAKYHGVPLERISVAHNGVYTPQVVQSYRRERRFDSKIVLFLGRITFQKGPDYFVEAAAKIIPHVPDVLFVMAGSGDMLDRMIARVNALGITKHFYFPGFLKGQEVEQMFSLADVYVMPSVSEPFGISALEAISFDTPVIISRQSGVSEVLGHALKVDFWDIDKLADLIINALLHEELRADMISMAREEVRRLHWDAAAAKIIEAYWAVLQRRPLSSAAV